MERAAATALPVISLASTLEATLTQRVKGEVRFDRLSRTLYATDASIYEMIPAGVLFPRDRADVVAAVEACRSAGMSIIARGAGTGLTGGAVGAGLQIDFSRFMNRIGTLDVAQKTVVVEPGVVLDELNAFLAPHGLHFAPDVATSSRATIGGMIANNSCGAHSVVFGRTVDHVLALDVVLANGSVATFTSEAVSGADANEDGDASRIKTGLAQIRDKYFAEIQARFPKVLRSNGGYGLDRLGPPGAPVHPVKVLCGSEGTLGIVVSATLNLIPVATHKGLVVLHFDRVLDALEVTPAALRHRPAAVELIDRPIIDAGLQNLAIGKRCEFLVGEPMALLVVEFFGESEAEVAEKLRQLSADPEIKQLCRAASAVLPRNKQNDVWNLRKSGLGLLMSRPAETQPQAFVEDSAVDPSRLRDYIERFGAILDAEGVSASYYAHASVGCLHVRPVVNLRNPDDVEKMRRISEAVTDLALEFGGTITGEHGDGIIRSCFLERLYGPTIICAFEEVKALFDPDNLLNPRKIVNPYRMTEHLRMHFGGETKKVKTFLDFSAHGGMAGLAGMCSGVGQCRQRLVGTMCPSYMATGDETHTTRARANALRAALSDRSLLNGLDDPALGEVMELCLSCKACKTECPTGVDMAKLKTEYLARRHLVHGVDRQTRFIADMPRRAAQASRFPRMANLIGQSRFVRGLIESRYGLDRRVPPPQFARQTFRDWFRARARHVAPTATRGPVYYFVDTWTNYFAPQIGRAAVFLLEKAGYEVHCPRLPCCGRPAISKGLLAEAAQGAEEVIHRLARLVAAGVPIVGTEPSCILTLVDEYPQLVRTNMARRIASQTMMIETLLRRLLATDANALTFAPSKARAVLYHGHCHQKALVGTEDAAFLLKSACGELGREINSGCCGMAGSFGHELGHYDVSRAIGEQRLFGAVRNRGDAGIVISGFSCRHQIEYHTGVHARHLVEHLADAIA